MDSISRSGFLRRSLNVAGALATAPLLASARFFLNPSNPPSEMTDLVATTTLFPQAPLPYAYDALEPHVDARTMELHYGKHHAKYVKEVADAIAEENIDATSAEDFFANVSGYSQKARNNGGGAWNHDLYWRVMKPGGGGEPSGALRDAINSSFGDFATFKTKFTEAGMKRFGSGWAWLVKDGGKLAIGSTPNQDNPLMDVSEFKGMPLLGMDVWEHAYYLNYQNKRDEYIGHFLQVINWNEVSKRFA